MPDDKEFEREVLDRLIKIEAKIGSWDNAKKQVYDNQREIIRLHEKTKQIQQDMDEMKEGNLWLKRTTIGAAVTAVVSGFTAVAMALL